MTMLISRLMMWRTLVFVFYPIVDEGMREQAHQIAGIISGDVPLGGGDSTQWGTTPVGTFLVVISLQVVQAIAHGFGVVRNTWGCLLFVLGRYTYPSNRCLQIHYHAFNLKFS